MKRCVTSLEVDCLETAIRVHEVPRAIGSHLFRLLNISGYSAEDVRVIAQTLYAYVDEERTP